VEESGSAVEEEAVFRSQSDEENGSTVKSASAAKGLLRPGGKEIINKEALGRRAQVKAHCDTGCPPLIFFLPASVLRSSATCLFQQEMGKRLDAEERVGV
jgi:hypothetical protein